MSIVYTINKGINKPVEFKGLKAQYIWYLGGGILFLLVLFTVLYIGGVSPFALLFLVLLLGAAWFAYIYRLSNRYGEHGMMKKLAKRSIPSVLKVNSRQLFIKKL